MHDLIPGSTRDRAWGALLGLAAGDAVGTTVEFQPRGSFEPVAEMLGGGPFGLEPGQWTDDTSMALCLAETIIDLTRDTDGLAPYGRTWEALGHRRGRTLTRIHHPIIDCHVTTPEGYDVINADIARELAAGRPVYIHCWGGVGRTGTVVGCWHVAGGATAREALDRIATARAGTRKASRPAPETDSQVDMIHEAERRRAARGVV